MWNVNETIGYQRIEHADVREFVAWMRDRKLSDAQVAKVLSKLELLRVRGIQWGRPHVRHLDGTLWELKVDALRVYFRHDPPVARCVCYGAKSTQDRDIKRAQAVA